MNRIVKAFENALQRKKERNYDVIYICVDLHETVLEPNYDGLATVYYPWAKDVLRYFTERKDIVIIMWTCSTEKDRIAYDKQFREDGILFDYINENPEVIGKTTWGDFETKMYTNLLLDDKAGFLPFEDWSALYEHLELNVST